VIEDTAYPYSSGDLLECPNTYFYSEFKGPEFIRDWKESRAACLDDNAPSASNTQQQTYDGPTARFLEHVMAKLMVDDFPHEEKQRLDALLRNFEAKKRIYEDYNPGFNSKDRTDYCALCLYVRFAEVLVAAYRRWQALPYLNALIKCMDILCAMREMLSHSEKMQLERLIEAEGEFVVALACRLGVAT